jgi:predicted DNA-binding transcriptional regulator YafY
MSAEELRRVVHLVAELSRSADQDEEGHRLKDLARRFGVPAARIAGDIRTLTTLGDHSESDWLLSLSAWQQGDRVGVSSRGPFRRPILLSPDERLALQLGLALDPDGAELAARLTQQATAPPRPVAPRQGDFHSLLLTAAEERRRVDLLYAGEGDTAGREFTVEPYELVGWHGRTYLHAWDTEATDWRFFRLDRMIDVLMRAEGFSEREGFRPVTGRTDLFRAPPAVVERVRVRFSPRVAPRVRERYPDCEDAEGGTVVVTFQSSGVEWLVRRVLEYGAETEVLEPQSYREAMRRAVAADPSA